MPYSAAPLRHWRRLCQFEQSAGAASIKCEGKRASPFLFRQPRTDVRQAYGSGHWLLVQLGVRFRDGAGQRSVSRAIRRNHISIVLNGVTIKADTT